MGVTKTENFTPTQNELAEIAKALSHPARIAIVQHLLKVSQCIGGEIVEEIPLAQPTISRHLKELKQCGIIKGHVHGNKVNYCIDAKRWKDIQQKMNSLFGLLAPDLDCG